MIVVAHRAFGELAELGARHEETRDVHPVRIERERFAVGLRSSIVTSTRSMSDLAQTVSWDRLPAEDRGENRAIPFHLVNEPSESVAERLWMDTCPFLHAIPQSLRVYPRLYANPPMAECRSGDV